MVNFINTIPPSVIIMFNRQGRISDEELDKWLLSEKSYLPKLHPPNTFTIFNQVKF